MTAAAQAIAADQQATVSRAREALGRPSGYETADLAERIGVLEYHVRELLALVGQLTGQEAGQPAR
jgi:hypothetical protein